VITNRAIVKSLRIPLDVLDEFEKIMEPFAGKNLTKGIIESMRLMIFYVKNQSKLKTEEGRKKVFDKLQELQRNEGLMDHLESQDDNVKKDMIEALQISRDKAFEKFKKESISSMKL